MRSVFTDVPFVGNCNLTILPKSMSVFTKLWFPLYLTNILIFEHPISKYVKLHDLDFKMILICGRPFYIVTCSL